MVILGGAAGEPLAEYDDRTPLEAASTPNLDRLARAGRIGAVAATPADLQPDPALCRMALLGYDAAREYPGRGAVDAAAIGIEPGEGEWALHLDLLCAGEPEADADGLILGMPCRLEAEHEVQLVRDIVEHVGEVEPRLLERVQIEHLPGAEGGALLVDRSGRDYEDVETACPDALVEEAWEDWMPASGRRGAPAAEALVRVMELAAEALGRHPVNATRREANLPAANMAWLWGAAPHRQIQAFSERYGLSATCLGQGPVSAGVARLLGVPYEPWRVHESAEHASDMLYERLLRIDLLCIVPEIGSMRGQDAAGRIAAIEHADAHVIRPLAEALARFGDIEQNEHAEGWRILVVADRFITAAGADPTPTPLLLAGSWVRSLVSRQFNERDAISSDLAIERGHELMEYFLRGGMADRRPRLRPE